MSQNCNPSCECLECITQTKGTCVFYQGGNLSCLDVTKGDTYDDILVKINEIVCELSPPTGVATNVLGCDNIIVTPTVVNGVNTFTVCTSNTFERSITNIESDIQTLADCIEAGLLDIVSDSITITEESTENCGRTLRLEIPAPSGTPSLAGVIYNNTDAQATNGGGGTQILKSFNTDYSQYNITTGDVIEFTITGQLVDNSNVVDDIIIDLFDATSATTLFTQTINGWNNDGKSSYNIQGILDVTGTNTGLLDLAFEYHSLENGLNNSTRRSRIINKTVSSIDYTNLTIRIKYNNTSGASTNNFAKQLKVEVKKLI